MEALTQSFTAKIQELKTFTSLRADDEAVQLMGDLLGRLEDDLRTIEAKLRALRAFTAFEAQAMPKVDLLVRALDRQKAQLDYLLGETALLPHNAGRPGAAQPHSTSQQEAGGRHAFAAVENAAAAGASSHPASQGGAADRDRRKRPGAPRRYVSQAAFAALSSYMTQRLTVAKVNAAVNEAAELAEANQRFLEAARSGAKLAPAEKKRAHVLQATVAGKEGVRGHFWFGEADMRGAKLLRHDKTGKALLSILRHLGTLQEVRLSCEGESQVVYVLK